MVRFVKLRLFLFFVLLASASVLAQDKSEPKMVRKFIDGFNSRNIEAMMSLVKDDVKWFSIAGSQFKTETSGKAELQRFLSGYFESCPTCRSKIANLNQNGNRVTMTETASWKVDKTTESRDSFAVYEFENGKIARVYYYGEPPKSNYDEALAKRLGSDERGMKTFVFVNLIRGKAKFGKEERDRYVQQHLENIGKLAESGKLVLAGPFFDDNEIRGIYVFDVDTLEKAKALTETDPAVKAGVFEFEMRLWYGSAALLELNKIHSSIQKTSIGN